MHAECLTALWNARLVAQRLARQSAQKHVTELDIFQQSHTNGIQFVINKESGQETILNRPCFVSKAGVLTRKFA